MRLAPRTGYHVALWLVIVSLARPADASTSQDAKPSPRTQADVAALLAAQHQVVALPALKKRVRRTIDKSEPTYELGSGESRAVLIELPAMPGAYTLAIRSLCNCAGPSKSVFVPTVVFLDAQFVPTHSFDDDRFAGSGTSLEAAIDVDGSATADRYALIFTRGDKTGAQLGTLRSFEGLLMKLKYPFFRAGHGSIEVEVIPGKTR